MLTPRTMIGVRPPRPPAIARHVAGTTATGSAAHERADDQDGVRKRADDAGDGGRQVWFTLTRLQASSASRPMNRRGTIETSGS
jgi:hypothetical protein